MNGVFPLGFPAPTALYLTLYVVTLALHVLFMNYLLAGSFYLAVSALAGRGPAKEGGLRYLIADALPFSAGLTITAGVAPLLFLQILYKHRFYTANLLLFHRWMMILPVLIVGFYVLYLLKTPWAQARPKVWAASAAGAFVAFAFVAWSWTENHLLSRDDDAWVQTFTSGHLVYRSPETLPRLLMWFFGALATLAVIAAWQLRAAQLRGAPAEKRDWRQADWRQCAWLGLAGLSLGAVAAAAYVRVAPAAIIDSALGPAAFPYLVATCLGAACQGIGWLRVLRGKQGVGLLSVGLGLSILGSGVVREMARVALIDLTPLYAQHAQVAETGALLGFVFFTLVNGAIIVFAVRLALRASRRVETPQSTEKEAETA